jgi:hypothetical protein
LLIFFKWKPFWSCSTTQKKNSLRYATNPQLLLQYKFLRRDFSLFPLCHGDSGRSASLPNFYTALHDFALSLSHTHTHTGMLKISHKLMGFLQTWRHYSVCLSRSYVIFMNPTCSPLIHCLCFFPPLWLNMRELENKCASSQAFYIVMMQLCFFIKELLYVER